MHTKRTLEAADALLAKIKSKEVAVFISNGTVKTCGVNTDLFQKAVAAENQKFMGVYDLFATREWIADDLAYCGIS